MSKIDKFIIKILLTIATILTRYTEKCYTHEISKLGEELEKGR